jgi:hypothetical protein
VSYFELPTEVLCEKHSSEISLLAWAFDLFVYGSDCSIFLELASTLVTSSISRPLFPESVARDQGYQSSSCQLKWDFGSLG